jgi:hypothetical protein
MKSGGVVLYVCQPTIVISSVSWVYGSLADQGHCHGPPHST